MGSLAMLAIGIAVGAVFSPFWMMVGGWIKAKFTSIESDITTPKS